jgi:hypothetical protein
MRISRHGNELTELKSRQYYEFNGITKLQHHFFYKI